MPKESEAIAQFNEGIKCFSLIHYYWETEMADSDSGLDRVIQREDAVPLTADNAVFEKGKLVGFFYKIPDTFRLKGQSHLFLFAYPSTHKRIIDSTEKYELRKK